MHRAVRLLIVATILIAGCGDDDAATTSTSTTAPVTTSAAASTTTVTTDTTAPTTTLATATTAADDGVISITVALGSAGLDLVVEGAPVEPGSRVAVAAGDSVHVVFSGGIAEELHIHGYDLSLEIAPGVVEVLDFVADIPGIFEVELEGAGTLVFELEVS